MAESKSAPAWARNISHFIFDPKRGWLEDDEKHWTPDFEAAACFHKPDLAREIGERQSPGENDRFFVLALAGGKGVEQ